MSDENPAVLIFDSAGHELLVQNGVAIPANTPRILLGGQDASTNVRTLGIDSSGRITSKQQRSSTGTLTSVLAAISTTTLLTANTARVGFTIHNEASSTLYLALAGGATSTTYTQQVASGGYYESPVGFIYDGIVTGAWAIALGNARITEFT